MRLSVAVPRRFSSSLSTSPRHFYPFSHTELVTTARLERMGMSFRIACTLYAISLAFSYNRWLPKTAIRLPCVIPLFPRVAQEIGPRAVKSTDGKLRRGKGASQRVRSNLLCILILVQAAPVTKLQRERCVQNAICRGRHIAIPRVIIDRGHRAKIISRCIISEHSLALIFLHGVLTRFRG